MKESTKASLDRYVKNKIPTGDFLRAVLENNLLMSFSRADLENKRDLYEIIQYVYSTLPGECWGSVEKVKNWLNSRNHNVK